MTSDIRELRFLLSEARDCVAEIKDAAASSPTPRLARIKYFTDLLRDIDKVLEESEHND